VLSTMWRTMLEALPVMLGAVLGTRVLALVGRRALIGRLVCVQKSVRGVHNV
jgi:hypothetical protein